MSLIKSKERVANHGEVFTPEWLVRDMLDLVKIKDESYRIDSRFLDPACGTGNFLVQVLQRKLVTVEKKYKKLALEKQHQALLSLMCIYGIELLQDNTQECRSNLLEIFSEFLDLSRTEDMYRAASVVLSCNLIHGDMLAMQTKDGKPITFAEWNYIGKGKFQRCDFRFDMMMEAAKLTEDKPLFAKSDRRDILKPIKTYSPMTVRNLASDSRGTPMEAA